MRVLQVIGSVAIASLGSLAVCTVASAELTPIEELGKQLFFDDRLSTPPGQSCASCHDPATAFAGPISEINAHGAVYPGAVRVRFGNRKPPTAAYASFSPDFHFDEGEGLYVGGMFWDGRALNTVEQAKGPFLNRVEQNNPNRRKVVLKVRKSAYAPLFWEVFGLDALDDVDQAYQYIAEAIAAYEASPEVNPFSSKYDLYLAGEVDLTEQEMRGLEVYEGPAGCNACHPSRPAGDGTPPLFTDFTYDNLGVPRNPENPWYDMPPAFNPDGEDWIDYGLGGRIGEEDELGKMKVPTLRNVGERPFDEFVQAYMHNGAFKSLLEVVDFYNTRDVGDWPPPEVAENVNDEELGDLGLTDDEVLDLVTFLFTLTDGYDPGLDREVEASPLATSRVVSRGPVSLRFTLPRSDAITIQIHDVKGRRIRTVTDARAMSPGAGEVTWDGADASGRHVAPGVYFYRIEGERIRQTHRLVMIF